jgi:tetratricopeptide (TPR) repeat protein
VKAKRVICALAALGGSLCARADDVMIYGTNYGGAKIVAYRAGQLSFHALDGKLLSVWIDDVELINVDRGGIYTDFNQAERFLAGGRPEQALARYRRTLRLGEDFWSDLFVSRMLIAADRAGAVDTAATQFIRLLDSAGDGPPAAARLLPTTPPESGGRLIRALEQVDAALTGSLDVEPLALLTVFRFELLRAMGDDRAKSAARRTVDLPIPESVRSERVYVILLAALETVFGSGDSAAAFAALDRAIRDCPTAVLPDLLLLKGEQLSRSGSAREDLLRATYPFLRVAIHFPDDPRAARGFFEAAALLERIGRETQAVNLLRAALEKPRPDPALRARIEGAISRLQSRKNAQP